MSQCHTDYTTHSGVSVTKYVYLGINAIKLLKHLFQWVSYIAKSKVSRLRLYKIRVLKYYVENKAQLDTWK